MTDLKPKSTEPIALAAGLPVRTLQEFPAFFVWDHVRRRNRLQQLVMDEHGGERAIGLIDASGHPKRGDKTTGLQRQYSGRTGKSDNCVVGLLFVLYSIARFLNAFVWATVRLFCSRMTAAPDFTGLYGLRPVPAPTDSASQHAPSQDDMPDAQYVGDSRVRLSRRDTAIPGPSLDIVRDYNYYVST